MKDILISEYKYSILIENIPNNISKKKLGLIAQDIIRDRANRPFYSISAYNYICNPIIVNDDMYFCDCELVQDPKVFPECKIDIKIDYKEYLQ